MLEYRWIDPPEVRPVASGFSRQARKSTLVFLHEGLGSASTWRDVPDVLAQRTGCAALVYSRYGHGASDPPPEPRGVRFMHEEATDVLPRLLDAHGIDHPILIGHSDGGSIALIYAGSAFSQSAASRSRVPEPRALVLLAPHVFVENCSIASISKMRELYATTDLRERLAKHHGENVDRAFSGWNDVWLDAAFRDWNIEAYLAAIGCPVLVIQGEDDEYGTKRQVDAIVAQVGGPVEADLLPRCGHAPHRDQRDLVLSRIAGFIARV